jgi:glycogen operon protein
VKLIAEPWDVGPGGYQVGNFPVLWAEWNDRYRDTMRDFWRTHGDVASFARRFTGSSDLYADDGRHPSASINYVTAHDGFTLADLVSYEAKHNEANGEGNRDGTDDNRSWNCGAEGPTDDAGVRALRARQQRNLLATLLLSHGVPMLVAGDEIGRTQRGNNNAWCQDNELSWLDWELDEEKERLLEFARRVVHLRRRHPVFRRSRFLDGHSERPTLPDSWWLRPDGRKMTKRDWETPGTHVVGLYLNGNEVGSRTPEGEPVVDDSFLLLVNASPEPVPLVLPPHRFGARWEVELSTADPDAPALSLPARGRLHVEARSLVLLRSA